MFKKVIIAVLVFCFLFASVQQVNAREGFNIFFDYEEDVVTPVYSIDKSIITDEPVTIECGSGNQLFSNLEGLELAKNLYQGYLSHIEELVEGLANGKDVSYNLEVAKPYSVETIYSAGRWWGSSTYNGLGMPVIPLIPTKTKNNKYVYSITYKKEYSELTPKLVKEMNKLVDKAKEFSSDKDKLQCFYDYSLDIKYSLTPGPGGNLYGFYINKKAKCTGFSSALKLFCDRVGVKCISLVMINRHISNMVFIDGKWLLYDPTFRLVAAPGVTLPKFSFCYDKQSEEYNYLMKQYKLTDAEIFYADVSRYICYPQMGSLSIVDKTEKKKV